MAGPQANPSNLPVALTIAGSDSGAGAGIQADLLSFAALGVYGITAITCLTAQNPRGVSAVQAATPDFVKAQLDQLSDFFRIGALKTGMLFNAAIVEVVADFLEEHPNIAAVVDPVMVATSGAVLLREDAVNAISSRLLPKARLITPNLDEAAVLIGQRASTASEMEEAGRQLAIRFDTAILMKGGHLDGRDVHDILVTPKGDVRAFSHERIDGVNGHGTGCTLSAAICACLARGDDLPAAVENGRAYLLSTLRNPLQVSGERFMAHL